MKTVPGLLICVVLGSSFFSVKDTTNNLNIEAAPVIYDTATPNGLFDPAEILDIQLSGDLRTLMNDKGETPTYHPLVISYKGADSSVVSIPIEARQRGHFRRTIGDCSYPPLLLHFFKNEQQGSSIFNEQEKLKLVMPCSGDEYVIREWLVYKIYELITPKSFKTRLVRVKLDDTKKKNATAPFYGILLEEEAQMATRNQLIIINRKLLRPQQTEPDAFLNMAVFEYLIGNTDWSVEYLQNIKLLARDTNNVATAVPYDFDHAGIVSAPYAKPAEELRMNSVWERRYRGYCITDMKKFDEVVILYNKLRKDIYQLYTANPLLSAKYIKETTQYLDGFYATINDPEKMQKEFSYPCNSKGTGNVIIKGLGKD